MKFDVDVLEGYLTDYVNSRSDAVKEEVGAGFNIYYLATLIDDKFISDDIRRIYFNSGMNFKEYMRSIASEIDLSENINEITFSMCQGDIIARYENILWRIMGGIKRESRGVGESEREASFEGGLEGFNEKLETNINLVRQYYHRPNLTTSSFTVGQISLNRVVMMYDSEMADENLAKIVGEKLTKISVPAVQSLNGLQQLLDNKQLTIPRMLVSQRPDRIVQYLCNGKIILFLEGTATALILPVTLHDFFKTVDDEYTLPIPALFLIMLRYLALLLSIILPSAYVAIASYNPEALRVQLALSISSSRSGVPYPSFVEVLFMLLMMEFLVEASLRLPKSIGQTATTVGGLILGQAATQAHLVSNIMIIIVATVAISNFMIPTISMNLAVRVAKYGLLLLVSFTGIYGIYIGLYGIVMYVFSISTYDLPFLNPIGSFSLDKLTSFMRKGK